MNNAVHILREALQTELTTVKNTRKLANDWQYNVNNARANLRAAEKELERLLANQRGCAQRANEAQVRVNDIEAAIAKLEAE